MQSVATYPLVQLPPIAASRGGFLAYIRGFTLAFWMLSLQLPFWWITDWTSWQEGLNFKRYYFVGFIVCLLVHLTLGIDSWIRGPFQFVSTWSGRFITAFCALELVLSPVSQSPSTSALYAATTWGICLLLYLFWEGNYRITQQMVVLAGLVIFAWQVVLVLKLGLVFGYGIGGILRNYTGQAGLTAMACCALSTRKTIRLSAILAALFFALAVNSRGSMIAICVFCAAYYLLYSGTSRFVIHALVGLAAFVCLLLVWPKFAHFFSEHVLSLHATNRGIGSGFTGRWESFERTIDAFWRVPFFGCGFRASNATYSGGHSGLLRLFVETGAVGAFLVLGAIFIEMWRRFRITLSFRNLSPSAAPQLDVASTTRINVVAFAMLCTTLTLWVYEPLYINLGSVSSLLFWLMISAPVYITAQGAPIRR